MTIRFSLATTAAAALLALSLPAAAAPFQVTQNGSDSHGIYGHMGASVTGAGSVSAGAFDVSADAFGGSFTAWCLDLAHNLGLPSPYEITSSPFIGNTIPGSVLTTVKSLFDTAYSTLDKASNAQSAGFQMALWEILTETPGNAYDVKTGTFVVSGAEDARTAANGFLGGLGGATTGNYTLTFLQSTDSKQSLVTVDTPVSPVPLPAAGVLLFGALGGLGVVARRRKSTDA